MRISTLITVLAFLLPVSNVIATDLSSPVGKWKTIDDKTGKPRSIVEIYEENGEFKGKILKLFDEVTGAESAPKKCTACPDNFKDQPLIGMVFLWNLKKEGSEYSDGKILDPKNGYIYKAKAALEEDGKRLKVRGFIGFSLLGRTQHWVREE